jgi:ABC-type sulfate/molybdate transport systems ATPase subunit
MDLLQVKDIAKGDVRGFELQPINFTQQKLQNIAVAGETGSGKTTLLKIIAGLIQPDSGQVLFNGEKVIGPADKLIPGHKGIVYLSQHFELPNFLRVEQILEYANEWPSDRAEALFRVCRIGHLFKRRTDQLSGGEKQRIAIARLLIMAPQLFLLDEPFSNMDLSNKILLKKIINDISSELRISFIMISHDPVDILDWADRIIVMRNGKMIENEQPRKLYQSPSSAYSAGLFGKFNLFDRDTFPELFPSGDLQNSQVAAMVRPEHCALDDNGLSGESQSGFKEQTDSMVKMSADVIGTRYYGHYYETDVSIRGKLITTRSYDHHEQTHNKAAQADTNRAPLPADKVIIIIRRVNVHMFQEV